VRLRAASSADAAAIAAIYAPYVTDSFVSFETEPPTVEEVRARIEACGDRYPWLVAEDLGGTILGYAYATAFRPRLAYRYAVETTVYLAAGAGGRGIGHALYGSLIATLEAQGFAQAIGAVTLPNPASVRLHQKLGFVQAGIYRQVGYKMDRWLDVGLWQRALAPATNPPTEPKTVGEAGLQLIS
jgi:L-amino acid N-acyltransferase YncA